MKPNWRNAGSRVDPAALRESEGSHDGEVALKSPTRSTSSRVEMVYSEVSSLLLLHHHFVLESAHEISLLKKARKSTQIYEEIIMLSQLPLNLHKNSVTSRVRGTFLGLPTSAAGCVSAPLSVCLALQIRWSNQIVAWTTTDSSFARKCIRSAGHNTIGHLNVRAACFC